MSQDRARKRATRALMAELGVTYTAAARILHERQDTARCNVVPQHPPLVSTSAITCVLMPGHDGWHEMASGERWLDPPMVVNHVALETAETS